MVLSNAQWMANAGADAYSVDNSMVVDDGTDQFLSRTPSSAGNLRKWTFSCWIKLGSVADADRRILSAGASDGASTNIRINSSHQLELFRLVGGSFAGRLTTNRLFRDPHAWYNIVASVDTEEDTAGNRLRLYVNGVEETSFATESQPDEDSDLHVNSTNPHKIGEAIGGGENFDGYIAEAVLVDGSQLAASSFGEYDSNGVWRPVGVSGLTFGTNGFYLNFASSGSNLGDDASGNSNDFTNNNSAAQSDDSPTTNHCVWSPLTMNINASSSLALSSGNLVVSNTASEDTNVHGSFGLSAGKWYFEVTVDTINEIFVGVSDATIASNANAKNEAGAWVLDLENADKYNNDSGSSYGSAFSNSDVANVALDLDNGKIWIGQDGTYPNSGDPAAGSNEMYSGISGTVFPFLSTQGGGTKQVTTNFGQSSFTTSAPSGFEPWNTSKMYDDAAPTIEDGSANMQATLYTGNGSSLSVTQDGTAGGNVAKNSTFKPDLLWAKRRGTGTGGHAWFDIVRTDSDGQFLRSDNTDAEDDEAGFASFDGGSNPGFSWDGAGTEIDINSSSSTFVAWQWLADNTTGSSNTDGRKASDSSTITSTVSVNQTAGFSIVKWTGNASNSTIGHGLAATPQVVIVKNRSVAGGWYVGHIKAGFNYELRLDETGARAGSATLFNETAPTSSVFSLGTAAGTNGSTNNMIAYCWAEKEGYSKFGTYEGNDDANGPFVYLGFKPAFLMIKNIDATGGWPMYDNARTPGNPSDKNLNADQTGAEYSPDYEIDLLSNGFKLRDAQAYVNDSNTYIYMAFAEHPFAGTTPATAR